jgi:hypothetical protein
MPRIELAKSIEARKLNRRTGRPVDTLWLTVPFGAILENAVEKGDLVEFSYLGELYHCRRGDIKDAPITDIGMPVEASRESAPAGNGEKAVEPMLRWERLRSNYGDVRRTKVPGGWLLSMEAGTGGGLVFYPDPGHRWDGEGADRQPAPGRELPG